MPDAPSTALILLAAGASTRMGRPKQLLPVEGKPLLRHVAEVALASPVHPVVVVVGANADVVAPCLDGLAVLRVFNPDWATGVASSIRCAVAALESHSPPPDAAIIALADQPGMTPLHVAALLNARQSTGRSIAATHHRDVLMPPVCFDRRHFPALRGLTGDTGARHLLREHAGEVIAVPLAAHPDLDTPTDYERFHIR